MGGGGKGDVIFNIPEGGVRTNFFCFGGGEVLSKFLLDNSSFSGPPPDNYCTVPYQSRSFFLVPKPRGVLS